MQPMVCRDHREHGGRRGIGYTGDQANSSLNFRIGGRGQDMSSEHAGGRRSGRSMSRV